MDAERRKLPGHGLATLVPGAEAILCAYGATAHLYRQGEWRSLGVAA